MHIGFTCITLPCNWQALSVWGSRNTTVWVMMSPVELDYICRQIPAIILWLSQCCQLLSLVSCQDGEMSWIRLQGVWLWSRPTHLPLKCLYITLKKDTLGSLKHSLHEGRIQVIHRSMPPNSITGWKIIRLLLMTRSSQLSFGISHQKHLLKFVRNNISVEIFTVVGCYAA